MASGRLTPLSEIRILPSFKRRFKKKPRALQLAIEECIRRLVEDPRHPVLQMHLVKEAKERVWEAYVDLKNRVTFHYDADGVLIMRNNCNHDIIDQSP